MNNEHKPTYREQQLRERIVESVMRSFHSIGIRAVKMDDIALEFGISKRTLYKMFANKEELLLECLHEKQKKRMENMAEIYASSANIMEVLVGYHFWNVKELKSINSIFFDDLKKYPAILDYIQEEGKNNREKTILFFQEGVRQGLLKDDLDLEILVQILYSVNDLIFRENWLKQYSLEQISHILLLIYIRGSATDKGKQLFEELMNKYE